MAINRRLWIGAASLLGAAGLAEALKLAGAFDHRSTARVSERSGWRGTFMRFERLGQYVNGVGYVGHSTNVMVIKGVRVMTDPWFFDPAFGSLVHAPGPAALPEDIGPLDVIAISHGHPDHFDRDGLDRLDKRAKIVAPNTSLARSAARLGFKETHVLRPWESLRVRDAELTAVPAVHDTDEVGFVLRNDKGADGIYFAGDTAFNDALREIAERLQPHLAILPVDGARVRPFGVASMNVTQAIQATRVLGVRRVIPGHDAAVHTDPLAERLMPRPTGASAEFAKRVRQELPGVLCIIPKPGDFVRA